MDICFYVILELTYRFVESFSIVAAAEITDDIRIGYARYFLTTEGKHVFL